jgi:hypothetical protein
MISLCSLCPAVANSIHTFENWCKTVPLRQRHYGRELVTSQDSLSRSRVESSIV